MLNAWEKTDPLPQETNYEASLNVP